MISIHNLVRGLSPYPGAFTVFRMADGSVQVLKIFKVIPVQTEPVGSSGDFFTDGKSFLRIGAKNGFVEILELQLSGRKVMNSGDFLRGFGKIIPETHGI